MSNGENAAKGRMSGYQKAMSGGYLAELYNAAPPAPPEVHGLPWTVGGYEDNPLIEDRPSPRPPQPDRGIKHIGKCQACGYGFAATDAAKCPSCGEAQQMVTGLTAPGSPWF